MKTSNKVLFGGLVLILIGSVILAGIARANSTLYTPEKCSELPSIKKELDFTFESISVTQFIEVTLRQGDFKVELECVEMVEQYLNHYVEDGTLNLKVERNRDLYLCPVKFLVQCPDLKQVSLSNGARLITEGQYESPNLNLQLQNGSHIQMDVRSDEVRVSAKNGANVTLNGDINYLNAEGVNSSNITAKDAEINKTVIKLSNSAAATIHTDTLSRASLVNSSLLKYIGDTELEDVNTVNSSSIERVDN